MNKHNIQMMYPLSPLQQGILFHALYESDAGLYFEQTTCELLGQLDAEALKRAWQRVIERHGVLRTLFVWEQRDRPLQIVRERVALPWEALDWRGIAPEDHQARLATFLQQDRQRGFDLSQAPLVRFTLIRLDATVYHFVWSFHHLLLDGWSVPLVLDEVFRFYDAFVRGEDLSLPQPRPYRDYVRWWQQQDLSGAEVFWRERLKGFTRPTSLGMDWKASSPRGRGDRGGDFTVVEQELHLPAATLGRLQILAQAHQLTLNTLVQGAWALLLSRYSGESDVVFGAVVSGRPVDLPGMESMVGLFINTLPVRVQVPPNARLLAWLKQLQAQQNAARQYEHSPLVDVQGWSDVERGTPLFESLLTFENYPVAASFEKLGEGVRIGAVRLLEKTHYPLSVIVGPGETLYVKFAYDSRCFEAATIARRMEHFRVLLEGFMADPERRLSELPLLTDAERQRLLVTWNDTWTEFRSQESGVRSETACLHELFAAQAARTPDAVAVVYTHPQSLTYRELNERANRLAHHLYSLGVGPEVLVGVCVERSLELLIGLLGVLKAGGAYVPLDPSYPDERLAFMLEDSQAAVLITTTDDRPTTNPSTRLGAGDQRPTTNDDRPTTISEDRSAYGDDISYPNDDPRRPTTTGQRPQSKIQNPKSKIVALDADWPSIAIASPSNPACRATPDNLAYVIYTSGSTGEPKGVSVSHRALVNFLLAMQREPGLTEQDILLAITTLSFDIAGLELYWPLLAGARLVLAPREVARDGRLLRLALLDYGATIMQATPASWRLLLEAGDMSARPLTMLCGGEALPRELANELLRQPGALWNLYGPTETTIWSTLDRVALEAGPPSIGRPIANTRLYILDANLQPTPVGIAGELYIGGAGLARGYLGRPDLTAEKFLPNPFTENKETRPAPSGNEGRQGDKESGDATPNTQHPTPNTRLYRTGDLARYRADGKVEFLGRIDAQVKVRGYRIEPGEIEEWLSRHPAVREAVVVARENLPGDMRLVAYVVPKIEDRGLKIEDSGSDAPDPLSSILYPLSSELRAFLAEQLPDYMIPSHVVFLERLPLLPNGKVDRHALPAPSGARPAGTEDDRAPRTPVEELLAGFWAQVLDVERVGRHDHFFALGGHSLLATQVISRVRATFHIDMPLRRLFETPTPAGLAEAVEAALRTGAGEQGPRLERVARDPSLPLSYAQQRLWFLDQLLPALPAYTLPLAARLTGLLDHAALAHSLDEIVRRHEVLRTTFPVVAGRSRQMIAPAAEGGQELVIVDLCALTEAERAQAAQRLLREEALRPFDLARGPLLRAYLLQLAPAQHVFLLTMHHIIADGWSLNVLAHELAALYSALVAGQPAALKELPIQYADYAAWQRQWLQGPGVGGQGSGPALSGNEGRQADKETGRQADKEIRSGAEMQPPTPNTQHPTPIQAQLAYWKRQLADAPLLQLPIDRPRPAVQSFRGGVERMQLSKNVTNGLTLLSRRAGATLFMTLLAAFQALLYRYSRQADIVVGSPIANRTRAELEGLIGFFVNTLALRTNLSGNLTFRELLGRVRDVCLGAYAHQDLPFEKLVEELQPARSLSYQPLFQVMFVLQNAPMQPIALPGITWDPLELEVRVAKFDLTVFLWETEHGLQGELEYNLDLFAAPTIQRMAEHFLTLLEGIVADAEQPLADLPLLTSREREQLLVEWSNAGAIRLPEQCVHALVEAQAAQAPDALAVVFDRVQGSGVRGQGDPLRGRGKETRPAPSGNDGRPGDKESGVRSQESEFLMPNPQSQPAPCATLVPNPQSTALSPQSSVLSPEHLTYHELNMRANQLAHYLQQLGVGPEVLVGLCVERSVELMIGILGVHKAGGAYVPLDPTYPRERLAFMLADTQAPVLLTTTDHRPPTTDHRPLISDDRSTYGYDISYPSDDQRRPRRTSDDRPATTDLRPQSKIQNPKSKIVRLDADWPTIAAAPPSNPECHVAPGNLAYLLYTSGSTGQPKGVQIEHRGLLNLALWHQRAFAITAADRAAQIAGIGFDASVWEIWPYLASGASLHLPTQETRLSPPLLRDWLVERAITITFVPTPLAEHVLALEWPRGLALRLLLTGGDTLHGYPAADLPFSLVNNYGPTESTVVATSGHISAPLSGETTPSIGRPIQHTQVYILDQHLNLMPAGMPGELYIGGAGIARGYHNRPELTAAAFIPNPFAQGMGDGGWGMEDLSPIPHPSPPPALRLSPIPRLYRTGDLARYRPDGSIEFLGRIDQQVKIRGFRIELREIEAALELHPAVRECVVEAREEGAGDRRLVGYVVPKVEDRGLKIEDSGSHAPDRLSAIGYRLSSELRAFLKEKLPDYMIPSVFVPLQALPLTSNGKVNRQALPAPTEARPDLDQTYVPPQTELEQLIARVWRRVLPVEHVGVHDNFFDLGGHSLSMVEAHSQLQETFGDKLTLLDLFQYPTIHALANHLAQETAPLNPVLQTGRDVARARREALQQRAYAQDRRRTQRREGGRGE